MKKENKGITLVALVITIIVLIILAGVSINSIMNTGLVDNAKIAKNAYEEARENEQRELGKLELLTKNDAIKEELKKEEIYYNTELNYITGVIVDVNGVETVKAFLERVPGYAVYKNGNKVTTAEAESLGMATGMVLKKVDDTGNELEIGTIVVYGDVSQNGLVELDDSTPIINTVNKVEDEISIKLTEDIQKIASDVNHDGKINLDDATIIINYVGWEIDYIEQNVEAGDIPTIEYVTE